MRLECARNAGFFGLTMLDDARSLTALGPEAFGQLRCVSDHSVIQLLPPAGHQTTYSSDFWQPQQRTILPQ